MSGDDIVYPARSPWETFAWVVFLLYLTAGSSGGVWFLVDRLSDW